MSCSQHSAGYRSIFHKDVLDILMKYEKAINSSSRRQGNEKILWTYNSAVQNQANVFASTFIIYKYINIQIKEIGT